MRNLSLSLQEGISKRPRNTTTTKEVLDARPNLKKSVEADSNSGKTGDNKRLPKSLRIAIRRAKTEIPKELAKKEKRAELAQRQRELEEERQRSLREASIRQQPSSYYSKPKSRKQRSIWDSFRW